MFFGCLRLSVCLSVFTVMAHVTNMYNILFTHAHRYLVLIKKPYKLGDKSSSDRAVDAVC